MKIAITGHTSGLGQAFYNHFAKQHEVIGLSRFNGYDIAKDHEKIISAISSCDLFFNNAHSGICQASLLLKLHDKITIITSGSMGADYSQLDNPYYREKRTIEGVHKFVVKKGIKPLLLLKMGYLENYKDKKYICYSEIISAVEFWLSNPRITLLEFDNVWNK